MDTSLEILEVRPDDAGTYFCNVETYGKPLDHHHHHRQQLTEHLKRDLSGRRLTNIVLGVAIITIIVTIIMVTIIIITIIGIIITIVINSQRT